MRRYFTFSGMLVASSTYRNLVLDSGDDSFGEDVLRQLGENMAALVKATRGALDYACPVFAISK